MNTNAIKLDYDNPASYPPVDELMIALQDGGKETIKLIYLKKMIMLVDDVVHSTQRL
jgi:hypothetical protein